jgi:hypothetical protein
MEIDPRLPLGRGPSRILGAADGTATERDISALAGIRIGVLDRLNGEKSIDPFQEITVEFGQTWHGHTSIVRLVGCQVLGKTVEVNMLRPETI